MPRNTQPCLPINNESANVPISVQVEQIQTSTDQVKRIILLRYFEPGERRGDDLEELHCTPSLDLSVNRALL